MKTMKMLSEALRVRLFDREREDLIALMSALYTGDRVKITACIEKLFDTKLASMAAELMGDALFNDMSLIDLLLSSKLSEEGRNLIEARGLSVEATMTLRAGLLGVLEKAIRQLIEDGKTHSEILLERLPDRSAPWA
jgi:hypothetical protein